MKAPFKPSNKRQHLAIIGGLTLAVSFLGVLSVAAQATTNAAPATPTPPATTPTSTAAPVPATTAAPAADQASSLSDYNNWVTLGIGSTFVSGDKAEFQHLQHTKDGVTGGVDDFHLQQFVGKTGTLTVDGHALVGAHDYDFKLDLTDPTLGYIRAGYTEFRTWYDGNGGYYPPNNLSIAPSDQYLYVDRRNAWIEAGLTLPDLPVFAFRYEYDSRKGTMDSTSWGDTDTASATTTPTLPADRKIVPTYLGVDETRNIFQGNVTDKLDNTDMGLTLRYELDSIKDSTFEDLDPLDAGGTGANSNKFVTDYDIERNDIFNVHGFTETFFNDKVTFSSGFSYSNTDTNLGGSRIYGPAYNAIYTPPNAAIGAGFINLGGGGTTNEYVSNMNLMLTPIKDLVFIPAVRLEYDDSDLSDNFATTSNSLTTVPEAANTNNWNLNVAQSLEARYTGFRDWSLYATAELAENWGNNSWNATPILDTVNLNQNWNEISQKYTLGANWYPLSQLNFGGQYYHKIDEYAYANTLTNTPVQYPGYLHAQDFNTDDMNIRATWQALSTLSLVTRYDFQYSTVYTEADPNTGSVATASQAGEIQSCNVTNHIISENATWTPLPRLYIDAGGSYVINTVDTPVSGAGSAGGSAGTNNIVLDGKNDYWTVDAGVGYALDDKTDLRLQYDYYRADDYENNAGVATTAGSTTANVGLPYGADEEEHNVSVTLTHQFNKSLQGSLKYGYSRYRDGTSGGQDDYEAQLVYLSMKYGF